MENTNIWNINPIQFRRLQNILNIRRMREEFLSVLPVDFHGPEERDSLEAVEENKGKWLLFNLGSQGAVVSDLINWFQAAKLDNALVVLEYNVPLRIITQPPSKVVLEQGGNLSIICEAISFPHPEYQWFKGDAELLVQQSSELKISSVRFEDSGLYYCKVSKCLMDYMVGPSESTSEIVEVIVIEGKSFSPCVDGGWDSQNDSLGITQSISSEIPQMFEGDDFCTEVNSSQSEVIIITHQPQSYAKVSQGFSFHLDCKAYSLGSLTSGLKYQWYKDGRILKGEVSSKLDLDYLYPDPQTGETKFKYFCKVSNDNDEVFSATAVIELEEPNERARYFAKDKIAFLIGNDCYEKWQALKTPEADMTDLAALLKEIQFKVFPFKNLTLIEMNKVLSVFYRMISENSYALFFFAGHGFEHNGQTYLLPTDCSHHCLENETICTEYILQNMQAERPALNVLLIDACRKTIKRNESWRLYEEAVMGNNTVYGYSTSFLRSSYEGNERNSFFVKHLKKHIAKDISIQEVILLVLREFDVEKILSDVQNPVLETSLTLPRKLRDSYQNSDDMGRNCFQDKKIRRKVIKFECPEFKCLFVIENKKMDMCFNGIEVSVFIQNIDLAGLKNLDQVWINLKFLLPNLQVISNDGGRMTNLKLYKNLLLKKEIIGIQKLRENEMLEGILEIIIHPSYVIEKHFSLSVGETWEHFESIATQS